MTTTQMTRPPRENVIRAADRGLELREATDDADGPIMFGHFARFGEWARIDSFFEGTFMERIAPGAFKKTFRENPPKVLFQHGKDPEMGMRPLGSVVRLMEDEEGAYHETRLLEGIPRVILEGLRAGLYGASFQFRVIREDWNEKPRPSDHNPEGIPERTLKEIAVPEFGPVTFGAYSGATTGLRSMTDHFTFERLANDEEALASLITFVRSKDLAATPSEERDDDEPGATVTFNAPIIDEETVAEQITADLSEHVHSTTTDAPSTEGAGTESHPARERRVPTPRDPGDLSWIHGATTPPRSSKWNP